MRASADEHDRAYRPFDPDDYWFATLNGARLRYVITADEDQAFVLVPRYHPNGSVVFNQGLGQFEMETLHGVVRIHKVKRIKAGFFGR